MLAPFCCHFGAKLAVSWATWPHELALDGLVGLREALRIGVLNQNTGFIRFFYRIIEKNNYFL